MNKEEIKNKITKRIEKTKLKSVNLKEIYASLEIPYSPEIAKRVNEVIFDLIQENKLEPIKSAKKNSIGTFLRYRIKKSKKDYTKIKEEIRNLHSKIDIQYYLKHPEEYEKYKEEIITINKFIQKEDKGKKLTVNERSYQIFKDEKKLKANESILKKLGIGFEDLNSYETYEPFFYFRNDNYDKEIKKVLIIENRDTFWSFKKASEVNNNFYLIIYGEGKKILNSFEYFMNFNLDENSEILYFGDVDYEGINIFVSLMRKHEKYNILPCVTAYTKMLELENNPRKVKNNQNIKEENIEIFLKYFDEENANKLKYIFENELYIPQEIINYEEVEKLYD